MTRFHFIKQRDSMQCGVAALWMVCRHLGLRCQLRELEERCFPTKEGVSLQGIADAAASVGLDGKGGKTTVDTLSKLSLIGINLEIPAGKSPR